MKKAKTTIILADLEVMPAKAELKRAERDQPQLARVAAILF